jgi:hypothetical protein
VIIKRQSLLRVMLINLMPMGDVHCYSEILIMAAFVMAALSGVFLLSFFWGRPWYASHYSLGELIFTQHTAITSGQ